jgi:hypothetical protein
MDIDKLLKSRKELKATDDGMSSYTPRKKSRMVGDIEIPSEGADMPSGSKRRKIDIGGKDYELDVEKPKSREDAMLMKKGGKVSSASKRGDGCAIKGKTKGRMV